MKHHSRPAGNNFQGGALREFGMWAGATIFSYINVVDMEFGTEFAYRKELCAGIGVWVLSWARGAQELGAGRGCDPGQGVGQ